MRLNGVKGGGDIPNTLEAFRESAEKGNAHSQAQLARIYLYGVGVDRDFKLALAWYRKSAEQGNGEAQANLGHMYEKGLGVEPDIQKALAWYKKSVAQDSALGQVLMGDLYLNGSGVDQSYRKALACYQKSAEQEKDPESAGLAQLRLGAMYFQGRGVEKDLRKGFALYLQAAKLGNAEAQRCVGAMYRDGVGVERDHKKALVWFQKSAWENRAPADSAMGDIFRDGLFVEKNIQEAMKWYGKAVAKGDKYAKTELLRLQQEENTRERSKANPVLADPGRSPARAEVANKQPLATVVEKNEEKARERIGKAVEAVNISARGKPQQGQQPKSTKLKIEKKIPERTSPKPVAPKNKQIKKAHAPKTLIYLLSAIGMIGLSIMIIVFGFRKKTETTPASLVPRTVKLAAPSWPGPQAIPAMLPELLLEAPMTIDAPRSAPNKSVKSPPPVVKPVPAAVKAEPAPPLLRREYRSLDEGEISEMLSTKKLFDAQRNPGGNFQHRYEIKNAAGLRLIIDRATNLVWMRQQNLVKMNLHKTLSWIESLNLVQYGGIKGWRLPTIEEAASLLKKNTADEKNFLDAVFGRDIKVIWTGDRFRDSGSWVVDFQNGLIQSAKSKSRLMTLMVSSDPDSSSK